MYERNSMGLVFIIILAVYALMSADFNLMTTLYTLPGIILAITVHEYAHARVSDRLGDPTPERQGRLTLNPLAHLDPVGTVFLVLAGFGWGKPVEINPTYYRNPVRDNMLVAIAGPLTNLAMGFILTFISFILMLFLKVGEASALSILVIMITLAAYINVALAVFNIIPIPPLDGSKILRYFLKGRAREFLYTLETYSVLFILILFLTNIPEKIITPAVTAIIFVFEFISGSIIGLFI